MGYRFHWSMSLIDQRICLRHLSWWMRVCVLGSQPFFELLSSWVLHACFESLPWMLASNACFEMLLLCISDTQVLLRLYSLCCPIFNVRVLILLCLVLYLCWFACALSNLAAKLLTVISTLLTVILMSAICWSSSDFCLVRSAKFTLWCWVYLASSMPVVLVTLFSSCRIGDNCSLCCEPSSFV